MEDVIQIGTPPVTVHLRHSARARWFSLRVGATDGRVSLTLPRHGSRAAALAFALQQERWLRNALDRRPSPLHLAQGDVIPFEGKDHRLCPGTGRSVQQMSGRLYIPGPQDRVGARLQGFLKVRARDRLAVAVARHSEKIGRQASGLTLRDTRSRWGSCSSAGRLMFSWRLIMAPPAVLDYVAAHEVAHLVEMNHAPAFWAIVGQLLAGYDRPRTWLRENGPDLHRFRF